MSRVIEINRKEECFGCGACSKVCPKGCIRMKADKEGFLYPEIDMGRCIKCGKCKGVCPHNDDNGNKILNIYAAINRNIEVRKKSSSGGAFFQVCEEVIKEGGVVFGCVWDKEMVARHIKVEKLEEIKKLQGSKYVQSDLGDSFFEIREELNKGRKVVFSGTPCQVAGLKKYLGKEFENLFLVDLLCHGTPSPKLLKGYIDSIEKKFDTKVIAMNLRDKKKSWHRLYTNIKFDNGRRYFVFSGYDTYMSAFLNNMAQRPSCFECQFAAETRQGDITLGDFWGIGKTIFEMDDDKGTSMIAVNTLKGRDMWSKIEKKFETRETNLEIAKLGNKVLIEPPTKNPNRDVFYEMFIKEGYENAVKKWIPIPGKVKQIYYNIMRKGLDIYRLIFRKKY